MQYVKIHYLEFLTKIVFSTSYENNVMLSTYNTIYYLPMFNFDIEGIMPCICPEDNLSEESMNTLDLGSLCILQPQSENLLLELGALKPKDFSMM